MKEITRELINKAMFNVFNNDVSINIYDLVEEILLGVDYTNGFNDSEVYYSLDVFYTYYDNQWKVLKGYCLPSEANLDVANEELLNDCFSAYYELEKLAQD